MRQIIRSCSARQSANQHGRGGGAGGKFEETTA
jgi:hypothetical protein